MPLLDHPTFCVFYTEQNVEQALVYANRDNFKPGHAVTAVS